MGLAYVFALVVGMGVLTIQAFLGATHEADGDADGDLDHDLHFEAGHDLHFDADGDADADADAVADVHAGMDAHADAAAVHGDGDHDLGLGGFVALFLSIRFWVFTSLGFGLSGTLLHYLTEVGAAATLATAIVMGLVSGLAVATAFRALKRTSGHAAENTHSAVGRVARVILPCDDNTTGKVRIELAGHSVDLMARTTGLRIEQGDMVVIEEVEDEVAQVSRAPDELQERL